MKYVDMPLAMWLIFAKSFRNNLTTVLGIEPAKAKEITKKAKRKYKEIIARIPEFEKKDRFKMNLVNCAMFSAFLLTMPTLPDVDAATEYYKKSMMTGLMEWFCRQSGKSQYSPSDIPAMCRLDYSMSEAGGVTNFVREYTLASGGPYCDCGYKKRQ